MLRKLALAIFLLPLTALADRPVIDISQGRVEQYKLAVAPGTGDAEASAQVHDVLAADFARSGLFQLIDPRSFLADPAHEGLTDKTIAFSKWTAVGAQGLIKLEVRALGSQLKAKFRLFDTVRGVELLHGDDYTAPKAALRQLAHRFADDVIRYFTQEPGVFQTRIAYVRESENGKQIVVADSDGANSQTLTGASINLLPSWAPDGRTLAFTSFRDGAGAHLFTVDALSRAIKPLVLMGDFATGAVYAPDGLRFSFSASLNDNTDVYLSPADGSAARRLTEARGIDISATWSPDGKKLAFVSDRAGSPQIYTMSADGSDLKRITFQGNYNQEPAWSPRGDLIAFSGRDEHRVFDLYTVNVENGKVVRLTQAAGTNEKPSWAPNGRLLLFSSSRTGKKQLFSASFDGSNQLQLTNEKLGATDPAWGPLGR